MKSQFLTMEPDFAEFIAPEIIDLEALGARRGARAGESAKAFNSWVASLPEATVHTMKFIPWASNELVDQHYVRVDRPLETGTNTTAYQTGSHIRLNGTVYDSRLGPLSRNVCVVCSRRAIDCPGHFGYIKLPPQLMVFHPFYFEILVLVLKCLTLRPSTETAPVNLITPQIPREISDLHGLFRLRALAAHCDTLVTNAKSGGAARYNTWIISTDKDSATQGIIYTQTDKNAEKRQLSPADARNILLRMSPQAIAGLELYDTHPANFILSEFPVMPSNSRPQTLVKKLESNAFITTELNHLVERVSSNSRGTAVLSLTEAASIRREIFVALYRMIYPEPGGINEKAFKEAVSIKIKDKKGIIRSRLEASRVNFGARTVITAGPELDFGEVALPEKFRPMLTRTVTVTETNIAELQELLDRGEITHIVREDGVFSTKSINIPGMAIGNQVYRWARDGDGVIINRNPSIHMPSLLGVKAKFWKGDTVKLGLTIVKPLNADFDGDEINVHMVQGEKAYQEVENLMSVNNHIVDYQAANVSLGLSYDYLISAFLLTDDQTKISLSVFRKISQDLFEEDRLIEFEQRVGITGDDQFISGRTAFSILLPPDFYYRRGRVLIQQGVLVAGRLTKSDLGTSSGNIIHRLFLDYSPEEAARFLGESPKFLTTFLEYHGFTIGVEDCQALPEIVRREIAQGVLDYINQQITELGDRPRDPKSLLHYEARVNEIINTEYTRLLNVLEQRLNTMRIPNNMQMANISGAKGNIDNIMHIAMAIGQQRLGGERIPLQLARGGRASPYFRPGDLSAEARGFGIECFFSGMTMIDAIYQTQGSREGIINKVSIVATIGDINRQLSKQMQNAVVYPDRSVRNNQGKVIQSAYGYDCFNPQMMKTVRYGKGSMKYFIDYDHAINRLNSLQEF